MNTTTVVPMTKARAAEILYAVTLHILKEEVKDGPITQKERDEFIEEMKKEAIGIDECDLVALVAFVCDDLESASAQ